MGTLKADAQITEEAGGGGFSLVVTANENTLPRVMLNAGDWDEAREETAQILGCVVRAMLLNPNAAVAKPKVAS